MKFIITGGHHNSALVVAQDFINQGHQVVWVGHKYAQRGDKNPSAEYIEVTANHIPFYNLKAGKSSLVTIPKIPLGIYQAFKILKQEKPTAVLSFGSYLGLTVVIAAWLQQVPIFIHEQTVVAGKANSFSAPFARQIFLTWPQSQAYFPSHKTKVVGLPLRSTILQLPKISKKKSSRPTILILGGKQGSHFINQLVFQLLPRLVQDYNLIHQTGTTSVTQDYQKALQLKQSLSLENYHPHGYIDENHIGHFYAQADLVISRSGAHTVYELAYLAKPCLLIPFEFTHQKEQLQNAKILAQTGQAIILSQSNLNSAKLLQAIQDRLNSTQIIKPLKLPTNASHRLIDNLLASL